MTKRPVLWELHDVADRYNHQHARIVPADRRTTPWDDDPCTNDPHDLLAGSMTAIDADLSRLFYLAMAVGLLVVAGVLAWMLS